MISFKTALLLIATSFVLLPASCLAQVSDTVQSTTTLPQVRQSQSELNKAIADERSREIESVRSDIADLSKFEHGNEYLPKSIYKPNHVDKRTDVQTIAGYPKPNYRLEHHM